MTARTYYDADSTEGRAIHTRAGIRPSKVIQRVHRVVAHAVKAPTFDDRSHLPVRRYIARMKLTPPQLALLVRALGSHDMRWTLPGRPTPALTDYCERYGCDYGTCSLATFVAYRAALSLLVETPPRSRLDLDDLLEILMAGPGMLPVEQQASVASIIGAHVADTITGRPFKRRALVPREGASLPRRVNRRRSIAENAPRPSLATGG